MNQRQPSPAYAHLYASYGQDWVRPTPSEWVTFLFLFDGTATVMYVSPLILQPENQRLKNRMMQFATVVVGHTFTSPLKDRFGLAKPPTAPVLTVEGAEERFRVLYEHVQATHTHLSV